MTRFGTALRYLGYGGRALRTSMPDAVLDNPILNSPFDAPTHHWSRRGAVGIGDPGATIGPGDQATKAMGSR